MDPGTALRPDGEHAASVEGTVPDVRAGAANQIDDAAGALPGARLDGMSRGDALKADVNTVVQRQDVRVARTGHDLHVGRISGRGADGQTGYVLKDQLISVVRLRPAVPFAVRLCGTVAFRLRQVVDARGELDHCVRTHRAQEGIDILHDDGAFRAGRASREDDGRLFSGDRFGRHITHFRFERERRRSGRGCGRGTGNGETAREQQYDKREKDQETLFRYFILHDLNKPFFQIPLFRHERDGHELTGMRPPRRGIQQGFPVRFPACRGQTAEDVRVAAEFHDAVQFRTEQPHQGVEPVEGGDQDRKPFQIQVPVTEVGPFMVEDHPRAFAGQDAFRNKDLRMQASDQHRRADQRAFEELRLRPIKGIPDGSRFPGHRDKRRPQQGKEPPVAGQLLNEGDQCAREPDQKPQHGVRQDRSERKGVIVPCIRVRGFSLGLDGSGNGRVCGACAGNGDILRCRSIVRSGFRCGNR